MYKEEVRVGDVGTSIEIQIFKQGEEPYRLDNASLIEFNFQKPDGSVITRTGNVLIDSDPLDGWAQYVTVYGDLDQVGSWLYQIYIEKGSVKHHTTYARMRVYPNLPII